MANIRTHDMSLVDDLFDMGGGYVLNFSDRTMSSFFAEELNVDIDDEAYREQGTSKAKRLRCYLNKVDVPTSVKTLRVLWRYREDMRRDSGREEWVPNAEGRFLSLLNKMQGVPDAVGAPKEPPKAAYDKPKVLALKQRLEAKWQSPKTPAADLHGFQGKLDQKAAWARGLFVSISGFTDEGLFAFGRGKKVICMDGFDLFETLDRELPLNLALDRKVRRAAETGLPFERIRDLFPR